MGTSPFTRQGTKRDTGGNSPLLVSQGGIIRIATNRAHETLSDISQNKSSKNFLLSNFGALPIFSFQNRKERGLLIRDIPNLIFLHLALGI
jgi:hypothetical protein